MRAPGGPERQLARSDATDGIGVGGSQLARCCRIAAAVALAAVTYGIRHIVDDMFLAASRVRIHTLVCLLRTVAANKRASG